MSKHLSEIITDEEFRRYEAEQLVKLVKQYEIDEEFDPFSYTPPGPVAQQFITDLTATTAIMGPVGSGKTTACAFKRIYAASVAPVAWYPTDNVPTRMCRWVVLRDSFRSAEKTVLESWKQWFHKNYPSSTWAGGNDRPVTHGFAIYGR
ncbi:MAG: hypothetical protein U5K75_08615 [Ahrensia sp.]|nr:hypothetical protein [Ahrensia sp.]